MASPNPKHSSPDHAAAPVAAPATLDRLPPWDGAPFRNALVGLTAIFGFNAYIHQVQGDHDAVAYLAFVYVNMVLFVLCQRWFDHAPPGSAARRVAGLAVLLLMASLTSLFVWKTTAGEPLAFKVFIFSLTVASAVAAYIYGRGKDYE